ncbi:hypothetical protein [Rugamonas sp.]|uniref:hypothetical protein n=1 Tax=Rugamonas sp. TaxID=1926287 RepID=UPI0025EB1DA2|nr:hypothetical protein [Rugamonas sp.]
MATNIQASLRPVAAASPPMDTQERIAMLQKAIMTIQQQLRDLNKRLQSETNVLARMAIEHQIMELTQMQKSMQEQIVLLAQMDERRKQMSENKALLADVATSGGPAQGAAHAQ